MKLQRICAELGVLMAASIAAWAGSICPAGNGANPFAHNPDNAGTGCNIVITINAGGVLAVSIKDTVAFADDADDILIGVVNNSGSAVASLSLNGAGIFDFDGDGMCTNTFVGSSYCPAGNADPGDYAGPITTFPGWGSTPNRGTIAFTGGLGNGATTYLSLEGDPRFVGITGNATFVTPGASGTGGVPALSDAGLILLAASLAGAAIWKMRGSALQN